mmetsp:Transcript_1529/g.1049  ORF Transcript_1529/g.1049 Transcript_1529/m.1049 type:complete len:147 (+) Transcript_1529:930-1370(+)
MSTEEGIVVRLKGATALVKTTRSSACESCTQKDSCVTDKNTKEMEVEVENFAGAQVGDSVVISIKTSFLLKLSFLLYVFPILCMIIGAVIGQRYAYAMELDVSIHSILAGFVFFIVSFFLIRAKGNSMAEKKEYIPKIIRIKKRHA